MGFVSIKTELNKREEQKSGDFQNREFSHTFGKKVRNFGEGGEFKNKFQFTIQNDDFLGTVNKLEENNSRILSNKHILQTDISRQFSREEEDKKFENVTKLF